MFIKIQDSRVELTFLLQSFYQSVLNYKITISRSKHIHLIKTIESSMTYSVLVDSKSGMLNYLLETTAHKNCRLYSQQ